MTPETKCGELIKQYYGLESRDGFGDSITYDLAKQCAIIHVNGIIEVVVSAWDKLGCGEIGELKDYIPYIFWQDVLIEIEKL